MVRWAATLALTIVSSTPCLWPSTCTIETVVWPPNGEILPPNAQIVISAYGPNLRHLLKIDRYKPVLVHAKSRIRLSAGDDFRISSFGQVVLVPKAPLKAGVNYSLALSFPPERGLGSLVGGPWEVSAVPDRTPPVWESDPAVSDARAYDTLFGRRATVVVQIPIHDDSSVQALIALSGKGLSEPLLYRLPIVSGAITLRQGTCQPFRFVSGERYELSLSVIDVAGNLSKAPNGPTVFRAPMPAPADRFEVTVDLPQLPAAVEELRLEYPELAKVARVEDAVSVELQVREDGTVIEARVTGGQFAMLTEYAASALKQWVFEPSTNGEDVRHVQVVAHFKIVTPPYNPDWSP